MGEDGWLAFQRQEKVEEGWGKKSTERTRGEGREGEIGREGRKGEQR